MSPGPGTLGDSVTATPAVSDWCVEEVPPMGPRPGSLAKPGSELRARSRRGLWLKVRQ